MARNIQDTSRGTPSLVQRGALLMEWLVKHGRITEPEAGRLVAQRMLGDWNDLDGRERKHWIDKAHGCLVSMSLVSPVYNLRWPTLTRRVERVWYYRGREPRHHLEKDLARPGCDTD